MENTHENRVRQVAIPGTLLSRIFGQLDENIKKIENAFQVHIINRDDTVQIISLTPSDTGAEKAEAVLRKLLLIAKKGDAITEQQVNYLIASVTDEHFDHIEKLNDDTVCMSVSGRPVKPKTVGQKKYVDLIRKNTITFAIGPAGTGKTYRAMAMAGTAFRSGQVNRIILTRPAIEAGEKLGFLPGDLQQKVDPYLRPLYDALNDIMGNETFQRNSERGLIEVAPLAYMRGRTLDNAFIVLDEAQNTTPQQMKMFLTRIGFNSRCVVTGDITQIDLPDGNTSGLNDAVRILEGIPDIAVSKLTSSDVVRHPLVQQIINAYGKHEARAAYRENKKAALRKVRRFRRAAPK
jgi:phosphate starvation-inducible PhoH-like protein